MSATASTADIGRRASAQPQEPMTVLDAIAAHAEARPRGVALLAPGCSPVTYAELQRLVDERAWRLAEHGVRPSSRVVVAMPPGTEAVIATLAVMSCARALPVSSVLAKTECDARLRVLAPDLLVAPEGPSDVKASALGCGIPVFAWPDAPRHGHDASAASEFRARRAGPTAAEPAVILPTSGTTGEPKRVPLTHANLVASAGHIVDALALTPGDRFLNVATLHHIAGLGLVLASLVAGASTVCAPGYCGAQFRAWMDEFRPTWMWLAPAMLRDLVRRERGALRDVVARGRLRFVRTGSAPLQPTLLEEAEAALGVPVLETYGMTEASPQITCAPLPPRRRKPGSAGVAAGPEIRIVRDDGTQAEAGETGEIVIRGANVMSGYEVDEAPASDRFANGWFHTGDVGYLDQEGFLFVSGRKRELINCGGEKVSPREVEDVLLGHPALADAVAFPLPDARLSEVVGAVVVPFAHKHKEVTETDVRHFVAERLPRHKVPVRVVIAEEIPRTAAGKTDRAAVAAAYGRTSRSPHDSRPTTLASPVASSELEPRLAAVWARLLGREQVGIHDDFFEVGGDSFAMAELLLAVEDEFGVSGSVLELEFCQAPTVATQAQVIARADRRNDTTLRRRGVVSVAPTSEGAPTRATPGAAAAARPLFVVPLAGGNPYYLMPFAARVAACRPVHFLDAEELARDDEPTVERLAARCAEAIVGIDPAGPYLLSGHCFGGIVAYEVARQLKAAGRQVALLALFDTPMPGYPHPARDFGACLRGAAYYLWKSVSTGTPLATVASVLGSLGRHVRRLAQGRVEQAVRLPGAPSSARMLWRYQPGPYSDPVSQLIASANPQTGTPLDRRLGWRRLVASFDVSIIDANHFTMFDADHVDDVARFLERAMTGVRGGSCAPVARLDEALGNGVRQFDSAPRHRLASLIQAIRPGEQA